MKVYIHCLYSDCEKGMKEEVIVMEESPPWYSIFPLSTMNRYINYLAMLSMMLCLVLVIFPNLETSSDGRNFMEKYEKSIMAYFVTLVAYVQLGLFSITTMHPFQSSIFGILFIIIISNFTPVLEVSLFSFIYLIAWTWFVIALRKWISRVKTLYSRK